MNNPPPMIRHFKSEASKRHNNKLEEIVFQKRASKYSLPQASHFLCKALGWCTYLNWKISN